MLPLLSLKLLPNQIALHEGIIMMNWISEVRPRRWSGFPLQADNFNCLQLLYFLLTVKPVIEGHGLLFFNLLARVAFYYRWPSITGWPSIFQPSIFGNFSPIKFQFHNYFKCFKSVQTLGEMRIHSESRPPA